LALALVAAAGLSAAAAEIRIDNFTFSPQTLTVAQGTTITWVNRDDTPHRLAGTANQFKSPVLDTDETFTWTAAEPGKVAYFCTMHPHMTGTIVVTAK
jgi:plastocyanin